MKLTNTQAGPRGVNAVTGPVLVEPGQTVDVEVFAREKQHLEASGWFDIKGSYTPDPAGTGAAPAGSVDTASRQRIADLEAQLKDRDATIADLQKQVPERDIDKMTVPELRAHLAYRDIPFDGTKDKKADLQDLARKASAT